jgi:PhnB protein
MPAVKAIPDGLSGAIPYLRVRGAVSAVDFYKKAFGATENARMLTPDGRLGHADISIGTARIMLSDEFEENEVYSPQHWGGTSVAVMLYVENVDAFAAKAIGNGCTLDHPIKTEFYGDRVAQLEDPWGHVWMIHTRVEDVPPDEMKRREMELYSTL